MNKNKIVLIEKEANSYDRALGILSNPINLGNNEKQKKLAQKYLSILCCKEHALALIKCDDGYICPSCNGLQTDVHKGNKYYCFACGQKVQVKDE